MGLNPVHRSPIPALWSLAKAELMAHKVLAPSSHADPVEVFASAEGHGLSRAKQKLAAVRARILARQAAQL
eukprot:10353770-Heterocapsa_arctica.AAC.1